MLPGHRIRQLSLHIECEQSYRTCWQEVFRLLTLLASAEGLPTMPDLALSASFLASSLNAGQVLLHGVCSNFCMLVQPQQTGLKGPLAPPATPSSWLSLTHTFKSRSQAITSKCFHCCSQTDHALFTLQDRHACNPAFWQENQSPYIDRAQLLSSSPMPACIIRTSGCTAALTPALCMHAVLVHDRA